jgi:ferric-dicitrate binding protein FerR (iron transport regulator)
MRQYSVTSSADRTRGDCAPGASATRAPAAETLPRRRRLGIGAKLLAGFITVAALCALVGAVGQWSLGRAMTATRTVSTGAPTP